MDADKIKQVVALVGGVLGALLLFFQAVSIKVEWFNEVTIAAFLALLGSFIPLVAIFYGIYKNQYLLTKKAKEQEKVLIQTGKK